MLKCCDMLALTLNFFRVREFITRITKVVPNILTIPCPYSLLISRVFDFKEVVAAKIRSSEPKGRDLIVDPATWRCLKL